MNARTIVVASWLCAASACTARGGSQATFDASDDPLDAAEVESPPDAPVADQLAPDIGAPDAKAPDVTPPDAPAPDVPAPDAPAPDAPAPDAPAPDAPAPDAPSPDAPSPDASAPDVPVTPPVGDRVWVLRLGDGVTPLSGAAAPVFLDVYDGASGAVAGPSIVVPSSAAGANRALTLSGSASAEGALSRSVDGAWITFGGYALPVGTAAVATSLGARTLARVNASGAVDTRTAVASAAGLDQASLRAAVTVDGAGFWALHASSSMGQITYTGYGGSPATTPVTTPLIARALTLFGGQLLASVSIPEGSGVFATASLPRAPTAAIAQLPGFPASNALSPYGVVPFDTNRDGAADLLFVADDRAALSGGGVLVWRLAGGRWSMVGSVPGLSNGIRGLAGRADGANYVLYGTTTEGRTRLLRMAVDGASWAATLTTVATAGANQVFRGVAFAPR